MYNKVATSTIKWLTGVSRSPSLLGTVPVLNLVSRVPADLNTPTVLHQIYARSVPCVPIFPLFAAMCSVLFYRLHATYSSKLFEATVQQSFRLELVVIGPCNAGATPSAHRDSPRRSDQKYASHFHDEPDGGWLVCRFPGCYHGEPCGGA